MEWLTYFKRLQILHVYVADVKHLKRSDNSGLRSRLVDTNSSVVWLCIITTLLLK
jgi:hypothetical protein